MSSSPFRATVDMTGEQQSALDLLARRTGRSRNALIREAIDRYLAPPAEAARDAACDGRDSPPSAPVASESRVASARRTKASSTPSTRWCTPREDSIRGRE